MTDPRNAYRANAVGGASPVRQVVMLYEQVVEDLRRARKAIESNHIESRTNAITHAITVIAHLQNKLNLEAGGAVARNLERFYNMVRTRLLQAQMHGSKDVLDEQIPLLLELRDAWTEVDRAESAHADRVPPHPGVEMPAALEPKPHGDWRG
jgi:flagellar protein FliS